MKEGKEHLTTESIYQKTLQHVAPLPSQAAYAHNLASIFSMHVHRNELIDDGFPPDDLPAPSAIVVAPTGQGKTFLVRKMAECLNLNIITIDCSSLSAEGWKGTSLSQRLAAAKEEIKDDEAFARSILFFDEVDKLRFWGTKNDQGNAMVNILQLFNGGTVAIEVDKQIDNIDASRFTMLFGGAFDGLDEIIQERVFPKRKIGFDNGGADEVPSKGDLMQMVTSADLAKFGLMPELLGRIGTIPTIPPLELEDYRKLLNAEAGSLQMKYHNYLHALYGVSFEIASAGVETIAQACMQASTGARAVNPIVNDEMRIAIAAVEKEAAICRVILDVDENGCCVRYEHGERDYAFRNPTRGQESLQTVTIKAKNPGTLVRKLCRYYRNAGGELGVELQLESFLSCAVTFLYHCAKPSEFTFDSLEKLARVVRRSPGKDGKSPFDIILGDARKCISFTQQNLFNKAYTPSMQTRLVSALELIAVYIEGKNKRGQVVFEVPKKKPF